MKMRFLMLPHPLTNFEMQNELRFNDVYSTNNLPKNNNNNIKKKDGAYVICHAIPFKLTEQI